MAPQNIDNQTLDILSCLFDEEAEVGFRTRGTIQTDGGVDDDDDFDPVVIADKLREVADHLDKEFLKPHIKIIQQAAADKMVEEFGRSVDSLCSSHVAQKLEVAPEFQLLKASMALGLYVRKTCPDLKDSIQITMAAFIKSRLAGWISRQGGWVGTKGIPKTFI
ncbi:hypothetical protein DPEC_G00209740 [Dallia pectoralis]|uniref:Uncharacterized protein n=1 Tax=Dallia pectoralis TaxID=75939 RepID=A0ACC2G5R3_DALPE|nr:hypothetical protein DPEC_G00209740 [Dallia pectoralis]